MALFRRNKGSFGQENGRSHSFDPEESRSSQPVQRSASSAPKWFSLKRTRRAEPEIRLRGSFLPEELTSDRPGWTRRPEARIDAPPPSPSLKPATMKSTANALDGQKPRHAEGTADPVREASASARPASLPEAPGSKSPIVGKTPAPAKSTPVLKAAPQPGWLGARQPKGSSEAAREGTRRSDITIAGLGITLGFICALFPWYIFFNPEKFGPPAMKFEGGGQTTGPVASGPQPQRVGAPMNIEDVPVMKLDLFATGTVPRGGGKDDGSDDASSPPGLAEQPFPAEIPRFKLVHVANGRAMIEDDTGLWIVQRGSILPDSSKVEGIEQRDGKWALVTSNDRVIELTP